MKLFMMSFLMFSLGMCSSPSISNEEQLFDNVLNEFSSLMQKNEEMYAFGTGGAISGGPKKDLVSEFTFRFLTLRSVNIDETRIILLRCVDELLSMINEKEEIRPYLEYYPFHTSGVDLVITFRTFENPESPNKADVFAVFLFDNRIEYTLYEKGEYITLLVESYQEAVEKSLK